MNVLSRLIAILFFAICFTTTHIQNEPKKVQQKTNRIGAIKRLATSLGLEPLDLLHPLIAQKAKPLALVEEELNWFRLPFETDALKALAKAKESNRPIFLYCYNGSPFGRT